MKKISILLGIIIIALIVGYFLMSNNKERSRMDTSDTSGAVENTELDKVPDVVDGLEVLPEKDETKTVIGQSVQGNDITAYHFGTGNKEILFIGGIHAGYSWNTVLVAYELMDYLNSTGAVPEGLKVTVIPTLNPDGQELVVGTTGLFTADAVPSGAGATIPGRFNANKVDLNRNFDCDWQSTGVWQNTKVSGGSSAFSEPESQALRDYVSQNTPSAVVAWYSAAGGVYASNCHEGVLTETKVLTDIYAKASGYKAFAEFNYYDITGDMVNWFAKSGIPAISVLLTNHKDTDWNKNEAGIKAVLNYYAQ